MIIKNTIPYQESYFPTPRHRKLRYRRADAEFTAEIPETTSADAPVVLKVHNYETYASGIHTTEYRQFDGQLYVPVLRHLYFNCSDAETLQQITGEELATRIRVIGSYDMSYEDVAWQYRENASKFLIVDGMAWERASEPFYYVQGFGLGNNHSGTSLLIDRIGHHRDVTYVFSAQQREEAVETAIQFALERGDTESVPAIQNSSCFIEVLDPNAVQFHRQLPVIKVEQVICRSVNVKAANYPQALEIAQSLPSHCFEEGIVTYRNCGKMNDSNVLYFTKEDAYAMTVGNIPLMMHNMAENIVKHLESCGFDDCTDCTGYLLLRNFGNEKERLVDVYKSTGDGSEDPHYVICCRYEDGYADFLYTKDLSVDDLATKLEEFYNAPVDDAACDSDSIPADETAETKGDVQVSTMMTLGSWYIRPSTWDILEDDANDRCGAQFDSLCIYPKGEYGFFIYIDKAEFEGEIGEPDCVMPEDLIDVVKYALAHGCDILCIDCDSPANVPELKTYDWN